MMVINMIPTTMTVFVGVSCLYSGSQYQVYYYWYHYSSSIIGTIVMNSILIAFVTMMTIKMRALILFVVMVNYH